jgi:hypothetical protein
VKGSSGNTTAATAQGVACNYISAVHTALVSIYTTFPSTDSIKESPPGGAAECLGLPLQLRQSSEAVPKADLTSIASPRPSTNLPSHIS